MIIFWYSFTVFVATVTILALTPAKEWIFILENKKLKVQEKRINLLESQIHYLKKELDEIASNNQKLKYALVLAGADSSISDSAAYDSLRKVDSVKYLKPKINQGNIIATLFNFIAKFFTETDSSKIIFLKPSNGVIINSFNPKEGHFGVDFAQNIGQPVFAAMGGLVIFAGFTAENGNTIILQHREGFITVYKHCSQLLKRERQRVRQGEVIALSGNSGINTKGPHLHFELWKDGKAINPVKYLLTK